MARLKGAINLRGYTKATEGDARREASLKAAEHVLGIAQDLVPFEEGHLERSGTVHASKGGNRATISFDTPYAVRQHEELDWKHLPGRQAKYLEQPMYTEQEECLRIMRDVLRDAWEDESRRAGR